MVDYFAPVLDKIKMQSPDMDHERLQRAYEFARAAHGDQMRLSGELYITHPIAVTEILLEFSPDEDMIIAALLHDVSEDTPKTLADIAEEFGQHVADLVRGLEKLKKVKARIDQPEVENLRRMFVYMASDLRIIIIKLCDRLHNMRTLEYMRVDKQERIASETLHIYVPIAARLGIYQLKGDLEDLCFAYLEPDEYRAYEEQLELYTKQMGATIDEIKRTLQQYLANAGYRDFRVEGRTKSLYSIYRKLERKGRSALDEIYDVFAMRIIVPDQLREGQEYTGDLYGILGALHSRWTPLPHRFKDYVAVPKPNGYRSLHTTLIGLGPRSRNQPTEIQIRTKKMHDESLHGIAAHWFYNQSGGKSTRLTSEKLDKNERLKCQLEWVSVLDSLQQEIANNNELIDTLESDIFSDRIFVLTPNGDVKDLPAKATPVDFAFAVHSELGQHCAMAKVNGRVVPLNHKLKNGDVVEIVTRPTTTPRQYWLSFVKTNFAKSRIRNWLKQNQDPAKSLKEGRQIMNDYLQELGKPPLDGEISLLKIYDNQRKTLREREDILRDVGRGALLPNNLLRRVYSEDELLKSKPKPKPKRKKVVKKVGVAKQVVVDGHQDLPIRVASCCKPKYPEQIVGYVTSRQGLSVHKAECPRALGFHSDRFVDVHWQGQKPQRYRVTLEIVMEDRVGLLRDISQIVSDMNINITNLSLRQERGFHIFRDFEIEISSFDKLIEIMRHLKEIPSVKSVRKVS